MSIVVLRKAFLQVSSFLISKMVIIIGVFDRRCSIPRCSYNSIFTAITTPNPLFHQKLIFKQASIWRTGCWEVREIAWPSLWNLCRITQGLLPQNLQAQGMDLPVASWSISLMGMFMGDSTQNHDQFQETTTVIVRVLRGQNWAPTFSQNSWEMMFHTARCSVSKPAVHLPERRMERGLCWEEPLELDARPGSHAMSSLSLAPSEQQLPGSSAGGTTHTIWVKPGGSGWALQLRSPLIVCLVLPLGLKLPRAVLYCHLRMVQSLHPII